MKLGLLTFHDAANYGAALQAYALQACLASEGFDCEYLNYRNATRRHQYDMGYHALHSLLHGHLAETLKYLAGTPFMALRKRRFAAFRRDFLKISARECRSSAELRALAGQYDKFVIGSDQVWCPENNGSDTAFLLDFVEEDSRKVAYASSFGTDSIPEELKAPYAHCLRHIGSIGVRERAGCRLVKELTGRDVPMVVDPVFLPGRDAWERLIPSRPPAARPFVFSYTNRGGQLEAFLETAGNVLKGRDLHKLARQTTPGDFLRRGVQVKYAMSPVDFLANVKYADLVVTASFHCLAFSLVFNKPFVCFLTGDSGKDERLAGLLEELGLENRVFRKGMTPEEALAPVDYARVNAKLDARIGESKAYLLNALKGQGQ
jgi:hypothetical protein